MPKFRGGTDSEERSALPFAIFGTLVDHAHAIFHHRHHWVIALSVVRHSNVRLGKILAFEQQWSPAVLGKRVSKTITEV